MTDAWDDMRKAKEDAYFERKNQEALERLRKKKLDKPHPSPVTGQPMEKVVVRGVIVDRCPSSGGIWLDSSEIDHFVQTVHDEGKGFRSDFVIEFFRGLKGLAGIFI